MILFIAADMTKLLLILTDIRSLLPSPVCTSSGRERDFAELCTVWPVTLTQISYSSPKCLLLFPFLLFVDLSLILD